MQARTRSISLRRGHYFAALLILGYGSGFTAHIIGAVQQWGWTDALLITFDLSAIVWISCLAGILLILEEEGSGLCLADLGAGICFIAFAILPVRSLNWLAVAGLSVYILMATKTSATRRGATILLASTVPLLLSPLLFHFFSRPILEMDASLISSLLGTRQTGTLVELADHSGELAILPGCSSFTNVPVGFLCWVLLSQIVPHKPSAYDPFWCLLACASVIPLNVARIALYDLGRWYYVTFHSPWANAIDNLLITLVVLGVSALGMRRELVQFI